jgi:DNA-binding response OmpR family regulator
MRVLLVEDYAPLRKALCLGLREAGFAVDSTGDGEEGLWYAASNDYDVVVLDLMLPGIDGLTILERLRAAGRKVHVLILSAKGAAEDRIKGLNLGADDYLAKPFALQELLARVRALVRRRYEVKDPVIRIADMEINTVTRLARRAGERIDLTPRQYALLEFLALRAGQLVTRTDIWEHVYAFESAAQSNVVDVYIGYLRRKIERPGLAPLIHTRRGQGFVLGEQP